MFVGYMLVFLGVAMLILALLAWARIIKPAPSGSSGRGQSSSIWDVLLELLKRAGWVAFIGLVLIYFGLKTIGVNLPPT